jgi:hypothetical protein
MPLLTIGTLSALQMAASPVWLGAAHHPRAFGFPEIEAIGDRAPGAAATTKRAPVLGEIAIAAPTYGSISALQSTANAREILVDGLSVLPRIGTHDARVGAGPQRIVPPPRTI